MTSDSVSEKKSENRGFASQVPRNLVANIAYFVANIVIGILLVPFFIDTLGIAAYGLIPLMTTLAGYVGILIQSLNTAISRFLTVDLQREDYEAANRTFNTALFGVTAIILLSVPVVVAVAFFIPSIFDVPIGQENGAIILFLGVSASILIRLWSGNFTIQLFAYNRLDLRNLVLIINLLTQTGLIILFFAVFGPDLALIGGAYVIGAVVSSGASIILARRICPHLQISIRSFDRGRVKDLSGMGWWVIVDQIGMLLIFQIDLIIVNMLFGANSAGEYAIVQQWSIFLRAIAGTIAGVLVPVVLTYYATKNLDAMVEITKSAVKFMGLGMALLAGLICGFAPNLLTIWVGPEYANLAPLMILLIAPIAISVSVEPLFPVYVSHNKVKIPGIVTIIFGIMNLILAIVIPLVTGWGYYGVAVAGVFILSFRNCIFVPWYSARVLDIPMKIYLKSLVPGILAVLLIGVVTRGIVDIFSLDSLFMLILAGAAITLIYGVVVLSFGLTSFEKKLIKSYLPERLDILSKYADSSR